MNVVFSFFIGPEYAGAFPLVPLYLISTGASIYSGFLGYIFSSDKRTNVVMVSTLAAAAVNVALPAPDDPLDRRPGCQPGLAAGLRGVYRNPPGDFEKGNRSEISVSLFSVFRRPAGSVRICIFRLWQAGEFLLWTGCVRAVLLFVSGFAQKPAAKRQSLPDTAEGGQKGFRLQGIVF